MRIGIDAGGTFTDFVVLHEDGRLESFKIRSNPAAPELVILEGIERTLSGARETGTAADIVHGSTVATNALLERKGARTAFVTTEGFRDLLIIARQNRRELYNLTPALKRHLVPPELCFTVAERTHFDGEIAQSPSAASLRRLRQSLRDAGVQSVALCLLHSYQNPANEQAAASVLRKGFYLSASHEICPEFREYERASTTVINAYIGPLMDAYLERLEAALPQGISVVQSNGGFMTAAEARKQAVRTILSGPAGGVVGAQELARASGFTRVLGFDMGGTSTDVSLCDHQPRETTEAWVDGFPIRVPMLDIHTVGAGGGSLARVDAGGLLRVGPESAGADPGPACYGTGTRPTVTDAHVALGRIGARQFLGGGMPIDEARATAAVDQIAQALRVDRTEAAEGILRVANANMQRAIRTVSVERGHDPREFVLVAFGGCGGLHACEMAEELGIGTVLAPHLAGALSALGMLLSDRVRDYAAAALGHSQDVGALFGQLERRATSDLPGAELIPFADMRYDGQSYELTIPWDPEQATPRFHAEHQRVYGYSSPERKVELVAVRLRARQAVARPDVRASFHSLTAPGEPESRRFRSADQWVVAPALRREQVPQEWTAGPALVLDYGSTTLIPPGWRFRLEPTGTVIAQR
jgi:N-methylhydantoinase A/oxoprolinase/acetone carboxylase beta subunit